jgi:hypothetical protein
MLNKLLTVDLKISEIIDILLLHPEAEAPPHNYRELGEHLAIFKLQNSQDSLGAIRSIINAFEDNGEPLDDEAEYLSACYSLKYAGKYKNSPLCSTLTAVEQNVVLGLILQIKKDTGGYNEEFLTTMQDTLQLVGFSTPQVWEVMTQHLNPESQRFNSADVQHVLQQEFGSSHECN